MKPPIENRLDPAHTSPDHDRLPLEFRERRLRMRTLDEQLTVRLPGLYRAISKRVLNLPVRSRLRRWLLARRAVAGYHGMNRGDIDILLAIYDPDVVVRFHPGGPIPPDLTGEYFGHDGFRDLWRRWAECWDEFRFEPEELIDLGNAIIVVVTVRGRGAGSGLEIEARLYEVFTFRKGLIALHEDFLEETEALSSVGL